MAEAIEFRAQVLEKPEVFFTPSEEVAKQIAQFTKFLFDQAKQCPTAPKTPLNTLYVDGFDSDQIWEQLKLQNEPIAKEIGRQVKRITKDPSAVQLFPSLAGNANDENDEELEENDASKVDDNEDDNDVLEEEEEKDDDESIQDEDDIASDEENEEQTRVKKSSKKRKRAPDAEGVEDGFFDWDEMEKAAEEEENENSDEEDEDLEDDDEDEDDEDGVFNDDGVNEKDATYKDFFGGGSDDNEEMDDEEDDDEEEEDEEGIEEDEKPKTSSLKRPLTEDEEEDEAERGIMSSHQRRMQNLASQIESLEEEALADKHWALKGEVKAGARPENSLLEASLEYDRPTKVAPTITVEVTQALEDIIKERIRENQFDDVIRKFAVNDKAQREATELSTEKSKEGLGEIYEKEYMKNAMGFEDTSEMKKEQEEIEAMFKKLCWKLDALSNFHFTPKPVVREMQVQSTAPAIAMEEAVPINVSEATMAAPEEVYDKKRKRDGVVRSREEMNQDERKAARNAKKHARRKARAQKAADERLVAKVNPGMGNKYEKKKMLESLQAKNVSKGKEIEGSTKQFSNSSEFFTKLQQDANKTIDEHREAKNKVKKANAKSASFYKL